MIETLVLGVGCRGTKGLGYGRYRRCPNVSQDIVDDIIFDIENNGADFGVRSAVQTSCWGQTPDISGEDLTDYLVVFTFLQIL